VKDLICHLIDGLAETLESLRQTGLSNHVLNFEPDLMTI
jgi:hypothetical protein